MTENSIAVLIIDDEPLARDYLRLLLKEDDEIRIAGEAGNGRDAINLLKQQKIDLIFLDVQMPEMDGFTLLKNLDKESLPEIVFTTAYEDYAIRAFEFHALDYLLKPFDCKRLWQAVSYAKERVCDKKAENPTSVEQISELIKSLSEKPQYLERLLIKSNGRIIFLKTQEIDWIKADDKYVHLYFGKSSHLVRQTLNAMKMQLDPQIFVQVHRSIVINVNRIKELNPMFNGEYALILENNVQITLSRNYKNDLFDLIGKPL